MSVALASVGASLAGAGIGAMGAYESGQATSAAAAYQAQVALNNAAIARQNAELAMQSGEQQVGIQGMKTRAAVGAEKAGEAASGVDVNKGSFVSARAGTAELGALDALTIRSNAAKQAYGYEVAATSNTAQAQLDTFESQQAKDAGLVSALGTAIGGVGSAGLNYAKMTNAGFGNSITGAVSTL
jgi:hypothetical protein